ncbi:hypothetical protein KGA66_16125 [Actinocrinis puniceicyclus]|uniref:Methyltransferase n=1 Tax=Actinocrinis puniceicyclus TaxID=977794 RepID=A0A8J8BFB2_9ACTN|nr:SCO2525 family SAM-dependent methyltransferase [Actinocrinis puniceicyclus]MBS2964584.1 hypothetical protein [Actinocrinis puniceicyclus]
MAPPRNSELPWDRFDPFGYLESNYRGMRADDAEILRRTHAWFAEQTGGAAGHGLDVGCGPNLYPGLAMLPVCRTVTLIDYSHRNIAWLRSHLEHCGEIWRPYWDLVSPGGRNGAFEQARRWLAERGRIEHGSVFDLPSAAWDLGTMFFVAESITGDHTEFTVAVTRFLSALRPAAPFAAAFMEYSAGYDIAGVEFPAVSIGERELLGCLAPHCAEVRIHRVGIGAQPLRAGYCGMLLALGTTRATAM